MYRTARVLPLAGLFLAIAILPTAARAQMGDGDGPFVSGEAARAWQALEAGLRAILDRQQAQREQAFARLIELKPSPLRLALLADYAVQKTTLGGAILLFEQDIESKSLSEAGQKVAELLTTGREQMNQADDGFYFCQLGRFDVADANFRALLDADVDPSALLEFVDRVPRRRDILFNALNNPVVGQSVRELIQVLQRGEQAIKADPIRIRENVTRLAGPPRGFENAAAALRDSGEFAVPFMLEALHDPANRGVLQEALVRSLPRIDRPALNPLVMALRTPDDVLKRHVIDALGQIPYTQSIPYLLQITADPNASPEVKAAAAAAIESLRALGAALPTNTTPVDAFMMLAEDYYANKPSLAADPRLDLANVWYWKDDVLQNVEVPTVIFNEIMCMRACEEALRLDPTHKPAIALWLAANFSREAQLPSGETDATRPQPYPPAVYFAQSAGPEYCLMVLARAIDDRSPAVALGAIEALNYTAGPASLTTLADGRLPLAEALAFPDRMVRIRAALALARARPLQPFLNYQNLMPVLAEALLLTGGGRSALVVDPDDAAANATATALRELGFEVITDASLTSGLGAARARSPGVDVILLASAIKSHALPDAIAAIRGEFRFAGLPVVIVTKPDDAAAVRQLVRGDYRLASAQFGAGAGALMRAIATVSQAVGAKSITPEVGASLALDSAVVMRELVSTNNPVFNVGDAEPALLSALATKDLTLRLTVVEVLGYLGTAKGQEAIAKIALDTAESEDVRVKMFTALAEAAKRRGNQLGPELVAAVVKMAESEPVMALREAASRALGAFNLPGAPASEIIRNQYRG